MKLDLHTHSTLSDGRFTPQEIVDMACAAGFRVLAITDFVSGMTDSYAVTLFKKLTGMSLPTG